ncbi:hypothetical protein ASPVEDRAFT_32737 [Aspergillus versicolor CBS 583.65]|uniref:Carboxylic ester hydrolase n=1 Tax=Aspergillus versicolor CBS 583.65 TaxID=1036611 RepID=A0A1L9PY48_ASPVE|nr:uncharacterized protein ASPVEDRAFT_32737 [Aspergillus versicolor CBS 583.65]OJJ06438.1 hypothetical protein ASPVEDRAFT_32737 [Aspergillus versicolor CBS 583.65]
MSPFTVTRLLHFIAFGLGTLAGQACPAEPSTPSVTITNGTILGTTNGRIDIFKGIPFAQPPVGNLRLRSPQPLNSSFGQLDGSKSAPTCMQSSGSGSEDCLKLKVTRPSSSKYTAKLPVAVYIHGGSFMTGSAEDETEPTPLVLKSIELGHPFILVSIQYRLGAFGFLPGKQLAGNANLGLRDQRLALQWIQGGTDNIAAFGGDPQKVVLYGGSAGSMSAMDQTIINNGDIDGLFRGMILVSGSVVPALDIVAPKAQEVYDTVAQRAGCIKTNNTLQCLQGVDAKLLQKAENSLSTEFKYSGANLPFIPRPDSSDSFFPVSPDAAITSGIFAKVPILSGDAEDEGTVFAITQSNITTNRDLINYLIPYFPGSDQYTKALIGKYPDDKGISGSPYGTGKAGNIYGQYKRLASIPGDIVLIFQRRFHLQNVCSQVSCWSYLYAGLHGSVPLGSFHGSDARQAVSIIGRTSVPGETQQRYAIAFINELDPNGLGISGPLIRWPEYTPSDTRLLRQNAYQNGLVEDNFRSTQYQYWMENISKFRI